RRRDAPLSWLTHRCVSRAARTRCDVESPLGVSPFQQRRCDFARWRRTGRWPAESQRRRLSPRISTRRWVADLDLSCARLGFRKAGNSSHLQNTVHVTYRILKGASRPRLELRPAFHFRHHEIPVNKGTAGPYKLT